MDSIVLEFETAVYRYLHVLTVLMYTHKNFEKLVIGCSNFKRLFIIDKHCHGLYKFHLFLGGAAPSVRSLVTPMIYVLLTQVLMFQKNEFF